jgi:putative oxidoreductase
VLLKTLLSRLGEPAYAAMRIVFGALFWFHGAQKLFGWFDGNAAPVGTLRWVAGIIETAGGVFIGAGLFTEIVAFIASGEMAAAYFLSHAPRARWPINNGGELAALYCFAFLYVATRGGGPLSLDRLVRRRR